MDFETAVKTVFNLERLNRCILENKRVWLLTHMLGYIEVTRTEAERRILNTDLQAVVQELSVEYIHLHDNHTHLFAQME